MLLATLVFAALLGMAGAFMLPLLADVHRAAHVHLAFALGVMPLIMGAMTHFVPVLTRTRGAPHSVEGYAALAWIGGAVIVAYFLFAPTELLRAVAALLALAACIALLAWQALRAREALGGVHPGLRWYLAALACLVMGLLAVLAMSVWPDQTVALKRLHLHLNLLGFVGLTAIGTLQVLLPTAAAQPDAQAAARLRSDLPNAFVGALLVALGAAWQPPLAWVGALLWVLPLGRLAYAWLAQFRSAIFRLHGATPLLASALAGFVVVLFAGSPHAAGRVDAVGVAHGFVFAFLFPLVSGAAGHLLPLWLRPGQQTAWHEQARRRLTYASGLRALVFLIAGLLALVRIKWAAAFALAGLLPFVVAAFGVLRGKEDKR